MKFIKYIFEIYNPLLWKNVTVYSNGKISKINSKIILQSNKHSVIIK